MKKVPPIFLLVFLSICMNAQSNLDSLYTVWEDKTQTDSVRVKAYIDYAIGRYKNSNLDSLFILAEKLIIFGNEKKNSRSIADGLHLQGNSLFWKDKYIESIEYYKESLKLKEEISYKSSMGGSLANIGNAYYNLGNYIQAQNYYKQSLTIYDEVNDSKGKGLPLYSLGNIFFVKGNFPKAINYYSQSLKATENSDRQDIYANSHLVLGMIYTKQKDFTKALNYCQSSLDIYDKLYDKRETTPVLNQIGKIYQSQNNFSQALDYYNKSLKISQDVENRQGIAESLRDIGSIHSDQSNFSEALKHFKESLKIQEDIGNKQGIAKAQYAIGSTYVKQKKYNQAIVSCQKSLTAGIELGALDRQKAACSCLYEANKGLSRGIKALQFHERMVTLDDSLEHQKTTEQLKQMEFDKDLLQDSINRVEEERKKQEEHDRKILKAEREKNIYLVLGGLFVLIALGFYSRWRFVKRSKARLQKEKDRSENLLLNILPAEIAEELKEKGRAEARNFDNVSVLFSDFKGFTQASESLKARELVAEINICFEAFDSIMEKYSIEKIKTIGDAYMAAGGLPVPTNESIKNSVLAALEMQSFIKDRKSEMDAQGKPAFEMRVGIHTGSVVAGIVGVKKFQYDIWGDTVNTASRMESSGEINEVNISQSTYDFIKGDPDFAFEYRGKIQAKGKGEVEMYFVRYS